MTSYARIAITGDIGSGKSAVGKLLRERLGWSFYSTGELQRRLAADRGMTTLELNKYAETHPEIDREIDGKTVELDRQPEPFIIDSRIAWHFIPRAFKVYLRVDPDVAVGRIMRAARHDERYASAEAGKAEIRNRRRSETERFREVYGIDLTDMRNFNLIVDTSHAPPEAVAAAIAETYEAWKDGRPCPAMFVSPKQLDPADPQAQAALRAGVPLVPVSAPA
jgi:cytidylate kinase